MDYEENILFGKIEGIVDLVTFEGNNPAEVKEAFEESVDDYLEGKSNNYEVIHKYEYYG